MAMAKKPLSQKCWEAARALALRRIEFTYENLPVRIDNASYGRILNWLLVEMSALRRSEKPWGTPTHVQIETSSRCNQRCEYCPVAQETAESTGHMDFETYRRFTDSLGPNPLIFQMWGWGEPFLNRSIYDMIRYAKARGIRTVSSTNAELFERREKAEQLVDSGLDLLIVSVSGITQETYGQFRPGSHIDRVFAGIRNIEAEKRRQGKRAPITSLNFVVSKTNEHEVQDVPAKAAELGMSAYTIKRLNPTSTRSERWQGHTQIAGDPRFVRLKYGAEGEPVRVKHNPCKALWQGTTLRWDGRINACAYDFRGSYTLGHAKGNDFVQIWTGAEYQKMRDQFRADWKQISICDVCILGYEGGHYEDFAAETRLLEPVS